MSNKNPVQSFIKWLISLAILLVLSSPVSSEDTEIFKDEIPPSKPNIMFVLDQSGSMRLPVTGTNQSRLEALREAFNAVMSDEKLVDVNVGMIGFSSGNSTPYPHGVSFPISGIDDEASPIVLSNTLPFGSAGGTTVGFFTAADDNLPDPIPSTGSDTGELVRDFLPRILNSWNAWGNTPIVDAYYEAALYFRGEEPKWGLATPEQHHAAHPSTYKGSSQGTVTQVATGNTAICNAPDCGINCTGFIEQDICPTGDLSCGLGTNCSTTTESWGEQCTLGTEAECMASDPKFTSCTASSSSTCSNSCISGVYHPETGLCIPDALNSFTIKTHATNMCLSVNDIYLTQEVCSASTQQIFYSTEARPGYIKIHTSNNRCFDVTSGSTANGAIIGAYNCGSGTSGNQVFRLSGGQIIADHSGKCLDVPYSSTASGANIEQWGCHDLATTSAINQVFTMTNEATSCTTSNDVLCQYPVETTRCDHQKYSCEETEDSSTLDSTSIVYNSPITDKCENNAIAILSDGEPIVRVQAQLDQTMADIKAMAGLTSDCAGTGSGRCGVELARFLSTKDQIDDNAVGGIEGDNLISTYTIGFDVATGSTAEAFLTGVANAGGGKYFPASNAAALTAVFKAIISDVSKTARSFAAPVYTVDPSSRLAHSKDIYIPLFENGAAPRWSGNLKKFKLNAAGQIVDKNNKVAVSADGILDPEAVDYWVPNSASAKQDKPNPVTSGGIANILPANRNLLTDSGNSLVALDKSSATKQLLEGSGAAISDEYHTTLVKFIQGKNQDDTARNHIGDILHSKPTVVPYANKEVIFFGTNEGYLHAINTADADDTGGGEELFAFMPSPLLANIPGQHKNNPLTGSVKRIYGVDGEMTVWIDDKNKNGKVDSGESAYLYFGLRRGGNAYYALDISTPSKPKLLWSITDQTSGFGIIGETWSRPIMSRLRYLDSGTIKFEEVLIFGGGYDASVYDEEDAASRASGTSKGSGVYIVNAKTGKLIWSETTKLTDSVPSNIRVVDIDRDGSIDRLYFGDMGGNVWRADLNVDNFDDDVSLHDVKSDARLYKFASLGKNSGKDTRKFFYEPDVSLFKHKGQFVTLVTIGSGYRSHPNNTQIKDRLFVLSDENAMNIPKTSPQALTDATGSDLAKSSALAGKDFLPKYKGWYKDLTNGTGEKSLSTPLVFRDKVIFTTFGLNNTPVETGGIGSCTTKTNNFARAYTLDLMTGSATVDLDGDGIVTDKDESILIGYGEIPDSPKPVFNKPSNCTNDGCDHIIDIRVGKLEKPLIDGQTVDGNVNLGEYLPKVFWLNPSQ